MLNSIKIITLSIICLLIIASPAIGADSIWQKAQQGAADAGTAIYGTERVGRNEMVVGRIIAVVNFALTFIGIVFFVLAIYAGFLWMNAKGNEEQVNRAKEIIKEVIVGLIIILLARLFTEFMIDSIGTATTNISD